MSKQGRGNEERSLRDVSSGARIGLPAKMSSEMPTATTDHNLPEHDTPSAKLVAPIQDKPSVVAEPDKSTLQCSTSLSKVMPEFASNLAVSQSASSNQRSLTATDHEKDRTPSKSTDQTAPVTLGVQVARGTKQSSPAGKPAEPVQDKPPVVGDPAKKVLQDCLSRYDELSKPEFSTGVAKDDSAGHPNLLTGGEAFESPGAVDLAAPMTSGTRKLHGAERDSQDPKLLDPAVDMSPVLGQPIKNVSLSSISRDSELPKPGRSGVPESDSPGRQGLLAGKDVSVCPGSIGLAPSMTSVSRKGQRARRESQGPKVLEPAIDMSPVLGEPARKASGSSISRDSLQALPIRSSGIPKSDSPERQFFLAGKEQVFDRPGLVDLVAPTISGTQLPGTDQDSQVPKMLQSAMDMPPVPKEPVTMASQYSVMQGKGILKPRCSSAFTNDDDLNQQGLVAINQDDTGSRVRPIVKAIPGPHGRHQELEGSLRTSDPLPTTLNVSNSLMACKSKRVSINPRTSVDLFTPTLTPSGMMTPPQSASSAESSSAALDLYRRLSDMQTKSSSIQPHFGSGMTGEQSPANFDSRTSKPWIRRQALAVRRAVMSRPPWTSPDRRWSDAVLRSERSPVKSLLETPSPTGPKTSPTTRTVGLSTPSWPLKLKHRFPRLVLAAIVVAVLAVMAALLLFVANRVRHPAAVDRGVCRTSDCVQHAQGILRRMNTSVNPCYDFHAYVCGSSGTPAAHVVDQPRPVTIAREQGRELVATLNHSASAFSLAYTSAAAVKALRALDACLERRTAGTAELFAAFMRERGIPWPASSDTLLKRVQVLDVIMELVINWRAALWFDVRVEYHSLDHGSPVIAVGEAAPLALYRMEQLSELDERAYAETVRATAAFIAGDKTNLTDDDVNQLLSDESPIRNALLSPEDPEDYDSMILASELYEKLNGSALNDVTIGEWADFLDRHMNMSSNTRVLMTHERRFQAVASLFGNLPPARLLDVVGWTLAYTYAWVVNPELDVLGGKTGSAAEDQLTAHVLCFLAVHESYGIAQVAPFFLDAFPAEERVSVDAVVTRTAEALTGKLRSSGHLTDHTLAQAAMKIVEQSAVHPWPLKAFLRLEILDLLYSEFPLESASFFTAWMESRKALKNALHSRYYGAFMLVRYRWRHSRVQYLYSLNLLRFGLAVVFPPSHLRHGSQAMTYAGLGFQLARQLVRIVDQRGRTLDYDGRPFSWWHENTGHAECRLSTATSPRERRAVADLFALDVALAAMEDAARGNQSPLRLKYLESMDAVQTFYISYCSHYCDRQPLLHGRFMCDLAINGSGFGTAFGCQASPGDARQCLFV